MLLELSRARSNTARLKAVTRLRPQHVIPEIPRNAEPRTGLSMGEHTAIMAQDWGIGRAEQDELAVESHRKLAAAYDTGFLDDLVTPYLGLERDQNLRPDTSVEKLAKLKPVFGGEGGTMTAGNSTPLSDGASAVLIASEQWASEHGLEPQAYLVDGQTAGVDYVHKREGLLMAPAYAVPRLLDRDGLTLQDFDFYEIHEAFAAQVLSTLRAWEDPVFCRERLGLERPLGSIDRDKLNVNGGSIAAGHPFAATGGRIVAALAKMLKREGLRPGSDLDLRGGRRRRDRDHGGGVDGRPLPATDQHPGRADRLQADRAALAGHARSLRAGPAGDLRTGAAGRLVGRGPRRAGRRGAGRRRRRGQHPAPARGPAGGRRRGALGGHLQRGGGVGRPDLQGARLRRQRDRRTAPG